MHRWVWDLHYSAPNSTRHDYPISAIPGDTPRYPLGPTVLPGSYTARLTANGKSYTATFTVKMDPRVKISTANLEKKFRFEMRLASLLSQTSQAVLQAGSMRDPLQKLGDEASGTMRDVVQAFGKKLGGVLGSAGGPTSDGATLTRANGQVAILYGQVWQADAAPTIAQSDAIGLAEHDSSDAIQRWDALKTSDLPALNRALRGANLPEIKIESDPHQAETGMDEE
jgi:hypothetical protein